VRLLSRWIRDLTYVLTSIWHEQSNRGQRGRRLLLFFAWQVSKRLVRRTVLIRLFNGLNFRAYPDCDVSASVLYYSVPDSRDVLFLRSHLQEGTFIDIGANVGLITLLVADKIQHAILFEPNPVAALRARENLAINHLDFEVCAIALSDKVGTVAFENAGGPSSCNRTVEGFSTLVPTITVPRTTLDRFLAEHPPLGSRVCAVKIDVEGHENSVLRGMLGFLRTQRPPLIMFEYLQRTNILETLRLFEQVEYTAFGLSASGPQPVTAHTRPLQNLFAWPTELAGDWASDRA